MFAVGVPLELPTVPAVASAADAADSDRAAAATAVTVRRRVIMISIQ
jgi:hypothetical protein